MRNHRLRYTVLGSAGCLLALMLTACGSSIAQPHTPGSEYAQEQVYSVVHAIEYDRQEDIEGYARAAVAHADGRVVLIGIRQQTATAREDVLGTLTFYVPDPSGDSSYREAENYCLDIAFTSFGPAFRTRQDSAMVFVACPSDPQAVVPPVDTSIHLVLAENAEEAAVSVLGSAAQYPHPEDIENAIASQLTAPAGQYEQAAPPRVVVDGENIGVAMGDAKHCVLVNRVAGVVGPLYVPKVLLQEGEYGCRPETALVDPEQLRPPH